MHNCWLRRDPSFRCRAAMPSDTPSTTDRTTEGEVRELVRRAEDHSTSESQNLQWASRQSSLTATCQTHTSQEQQSSYTLMNDISHCRSAT